MAEIIIKAENLCFSYENGNPNEELPVLNHLNLEIEKGSFVAILGHNGSGKSTLAKLFNMILTPTGGSLYLFGRKINENEMSEDEFFGLRQRIGMVFQNPDNQLVATIVEEDVAFGPENLGIPSSEIRKRVDDALEIVGMTAFAKHSPHQLSGGQQQRVAIARALALQPEVLCFDEPTSALDPELTGEVLRVIRSLKDRDTTMIVVTHEMEFARNVADTVIYMADGVIEEMGTPEQVFGNPQKEKTKAFLRGAQNIF